MLSFRVDDGTDEKSLGDNRGQLQVIVTRTPAAKPPPITVGEQERFILPATDIVCRALKAGEYDVAARLLESVLHRTTVLGGSAAQREVLQDTLVFALARSDQGDRAAAVLDARLSRRLSPLDARQRDVIRSGRHSDQTV